MQDDFTRYLRSKSMNDLRTQLNYLDHLETVQGTRPRNTAIREQIEEEIKRRINRNGTFQKFVSIAQGKYQGDLDTGLCPIPG